MFTSSNSLRMMPILKGMSESVSVGDIVSQVRQQSAEHYCSHSFPSAVLHSVCSPSLRDDVVHM